MSYEKISINDYFAAWKNWAKHPHDDPGKRMMQYLGYSSLMPDPGNKLLMSPEAAHKIRLLQGPHHQTIIKAWYAIHGL